MSKTELPYTEINAEVSRLCRYWRVSADLREEMQQEAYLSFIANSTTLHIKRDLARYLAREKQHQRRIRTNVDFHNLEEEI